MRTNYPRATPNEIKIVKMTVIKRRCRKLRKDPHTGTITMASSKQGENYISIKEGNIMASKQFENTTPIKQEGNMMDGNNNIKLINNEAAEGEMKETLKKLLKMDRHALKSFARSILVPTITTGNNESAAITMDDDNMNLKEVEKCLLDLASAIQEAPELLLDIPLPVITTNICQFLPTRQDWNNFVACKKSLKRFAATCPSGTFLPPWPTSLECPTYGWTDRRGQYRYTLSPDAQFLAYTEVPPGMYSSMIHVFSRKYGFCCSLESAGPFCFSNVYFKKTENDTFVQAIDGAGIYLEWKLFQSPDPAFSHKDIPKVKEFQLEGGIGMDPCGKWRSAAKIVGDGKYLLQNGGDEIMMRNLDNNGGEIVLHYTDSKINDITGFALSPNKKCLVLQGIGGKKDNLTILEACQIMEGRQGHHLKIGKVLRTETSHRKRTFYDDTDDFADRSDHLAFSPDGSKLFAIRTNAAIEVFDISEATFLNSKSSSRLPLLHSFGKDSCKKAKKMEVKIASTANGKHMIFSSFQTPPTGRGNNQGSNIGAGTIELWDFELDTLVTSFTTTSRLEAVSYNKEVTGERTFVLVENHEKKVSENDSSGRSSEKIRKIRIHEVDGKGRLVTAV